MSRFSSCHSVRQDDSFMQLVCSVTLPVQRCSVVNHVTHSSQLLFLKYRANGQHNTVVQGKYIAATSWLCVLLDNTTVDNVYIHLDIKLTCIKGKPTVTDWLNENDELWTKWKVFFSFMATVAMLSCFSLAKIWQQCPRLSIRLAGSQSSSPLW